MTVAIGSLEGKIFKSITKRRKNAAEFLEFIAEDGEIFIMGSEEASFGCDLEVVLEEVIGNLEDLVGNPILVAEERSNKDQAPKIGWTFYEFRTIKGSVTLRWMAQNDTADYSTAVEIFKDKIFWP